MALLGICSLPGVFVLSYVTGIVRFRFLLCTSLWPTDLQCIMEGASAASWSGLSASKSANSLKTPLLLRSPYIQTWYSAISTKSSGYKKLWEPSNVDRPHHFSGLTSYYRKFALLFANIAKPLNILFRKDIKFQWSPQCQAAFQNLKQALCKEPILLYHSTENHKHCLLMQVIMHILKSLPRQLKVLWIKVQYHLHWAHSQKCSKGILQLKRKHMQSTSLSLSLIYT